MGALVKQLTRFFLVFLELERGSILSHTKERIGFIGVGLIRHGMAKNIVENGYPLAVLGNRNRAPVDDLL